MKSVRHLANDTLPCFTNLVVDDGQLVICERLHTGTGGSIYLAFDNRKSRVCAVKCMPRYDDEDGLGLDQSREISMHDMLSYHPNVLPLYRVIHDPSFTYLVMEYAQHGDLFDYLFDNPYEDSNTRGIFNEMMKAVEACHAQGIYHRDIKPENFVISDGRIMLTDFSLATFEIQSNEFSCSRVEYMAPEAIWTDHSTVEDWETKRYSHEANDVWALGICLLNMIIGTSPWSYPLTSDVNFKLFLFDPEAFRAQFDLSYAGFNFLVGFLAFNPSDRKSVKELREELAHIGTFYGSIEEYNTRMARRRRPSNSSLMSVDLEVEPKPPRPQILVPGLGVPDLDTKKRNWENSLVDYTAKQDGQTPGWIEDTLQPLRFLN